MTWNHRLIRRKDGRGQDYYGIYEVYYDERGRIYACTQDPVAVVGESPDGASELHAMMIEAFVRPILDYDDILSPKEST